MKEKKVSKISIKTMICLMLMITLTWTSFVSANETTSQAYHDQTDQILQNIQDYYYKEMDQDVLIEGMYEGIMNELDTYSVYMTKEENEAFIEDVDSEIVGIGVFIAKKKEDDYVQIVSPIQDAPAEKAGLKAGDLIYEVNGESAKGWTTQEVQSKVKGPKGTSVTLGIMREGQSEVQYYEIIRDSVVIKTVNYELLPKEETDNHLLGYVSVSRFGNHTNEEFDEAMAFMVNQDVDGIIVDVRNNPGGYLDAAVHLSDYFVSQGKTIVKIDYRTLLDKTYRAQSERVPMEVAVLVNEGSASASEVFSGAIKENAEGVIIGANTFGKGTVQTLLELDNGDSMKLTIAEYILSNDYRVNNIGVAPDIKVEYPTIKAYEEYLAFAPMSEDKVYIKGDVGLNIYGMQQRLNVLGYELTVDGSLGPASEQALLSYQRAYNIEANGILDQKTIDSLNQTMENYFHPSSDIQLDAAIEYLIQ